MYGTGPFNSDSDEIVVPQKVQQVCRMESRKIVTCGLVVPFVVRRNHFRENRWCTGDSNSDEVFVPKKVQQVRKTELLQQSKWRCDVCELREKNTLHGRRSDNGQTLVTIWYKVSHTGLEQV